ncbi:hypothetical protein EST38_g9408 [Candolleomyces aberdarensis]|uniref:Uncharacterized protein n=1 Tax=Candolleomyces aberdarensis TaxID=2316362 RepID=A0A4Q2DA25_9AGAR|nr:hypothetical protein EST38_g9408 [Candolleomyces aberdarensis]
MVASRLALSLDTGLPRTPLKHLTLHTPLTFQVPAESTFPDKLREGLEEFRSQVEVSVVSKAWRDDYEVLMSLADADHWDRGFGEFIDKFGEL